MGQQVNNIQTGKGLINVEAANSTTSKLLLGLVLMNHFLVDKYYSREEHNPLAHAPSYDSI